MTGAALCGDCQRQPPSFAHTICALDYAFPWDRLISHFKFHAMIELARPLTDRLLSAVLASTRAPPELLIPVPLSDARLAERGFNQAWEVTRRLGASLSIPANARALGRVLDTPQQAQLTRAQRLANLRAAFVVPAAQQARLRGRHLALIDDVLTTGATAEEATQALLRAGAASVALWVLARTPAQ